jgi:hypothetical protein
LLVIVRHNKKDRIGSDVDVYESTSDAVCPCGLGPGVDLAEN